MNPLAPEEPPGNDVRTSYQDIALALVDANAPGCHTAYLARQALQARDVDLTFPVITTRQWGQLDSNDQSIVYSSHWRDVEFVVVRWDENWGDNYLGEYRDFWSYFIPFAQGSCVPEWFAIIVPDATIREALLEKRVYNAFEDKRVPYIPGRLNPEGVILHHVVTFQRRKEYSVNLPHGPLITRPLPGPITCDAGIQTDGIIQVVPDAVAPARNAPRQRRTWAELIVSFFAPIFTFRGPGIRPARE